MSEMVEVDVEHAVRYALATDQCYGVGKGMTVDVLSAWVGASRNDVQEILNRLYQAGFATVKNGEHQCFPPFYWVKK